MEIQIQATIIIIEPLSAQRFPNMLFSEAWNSYTRGKTVFRFYSMLYLLIYNYVIYLQQIFC